MIIIGEKINGAIPSVAQAIETRDEEKIRSLAVSQTEAGAHYLDICAGTAPEKELDTLKWLIEIVQDASDIPLCLDSPDPRILEAVIPLAKKPGILNSVSLEGEKCQILYPLLQDTAWQVVALTCGEKGIPADADTKVSLAFTLIEKAALYGITPERIYIDPLVLSLSAVNDSMLNFMEAIRRIKAGYPDVKITSGLSNISYGMPVRRLINQNFLALSLYAGMDSAIADPLNRDITGTIYAVEALLNKDRFCRKYNNAYRAGRIGSQKK